MTRKERQLRSRIRAACCPISGLSKAELERHVERIARVVENPHHANGRRR